MRVWSIKSKTVGTNTTTFAYNTYNRLHTWGSITYTYDLNGNLKTMSGGGGNSYYYDYEDRLVKMVQGSTTSLLYYDGDGNMVEANEAHTKVYSYEGNSILYSKDLHTSTVTKEIYAGGLHLAEVVGGTTYYDHVDALGSVREQTTGSITISTTTDYKPYGDTYQKSGSITFGYVRAPTRTEISTSYRVLW